MATTYTSPSVVDEIDDESVLSSPSGRGYRQPDPPDEIAFTSSIQQDFLRYVKEERNTLFTHCKLWEFKFYLEHPNQLLCSKDPIQQAQRLSDPSSHWRANTWCQKKEKTRSTSTHS
jgi:hypothetical protein